MGKYFNITVLIVGILMANNTCVNGRQDAHIKIGYLGSRDDRLGLRLMGPAIDIALETALEKGLFSHVNFRYNSHFFCI